MGELFNLLFVYVFGWGFGWYARKKYDLEPDSPTVKRFKKILDFIK